MTGQTVSLTALFWNSFRAKVVGRKFVQDVGILTMANVVGAGLSLTQGLIVARWLGAELYGVAALVMSYPDLVHTFLDARSGEASIKFLSECHARNERDRALAICKLGYVVDFTIASLAFLVVAVSAQWAATSIAKRPDAASLIIIYTAAFIPKALVGTSRAVLTVLGRFRLIAVSETVMTALRVVLVLSLVLSGWQVTGLVWGNAVVIIANGLLFGIVARALMRRTWGGSAIDGKWHFLKGRRREVFRFLAYNDLNELLGVIPKQLDVLLLGYFRSPVEAGYYKLAKSLSGAVSYLAGPLQSVTYPELARLSGTKDKRALREKVRRLAFHVGVPMGLLTLTGTFMLPFVLPALVGDDYLPGIGATQILLVGSTMWLSTFWLRPLFLARGWIREWTKFTALYAFCTLLGWLIIVPQYGYLGMSAWWLFSLLATYSLSPIILLLWRHRDERNG